MLPKYLYWTSFCLGGLIFWCLVVLLFILFRQFLRQEYWSGLHIPPSVDHILSVLFTMTYLSWVALHGMAHSFIELHKPLRHDKAVIHEGAHLSRVYCLLLAWEYFTYAKSSMCYLSTALQSYLEITLHILNRICFPYIFSKSGESVSCSLMSDSL